MRPSNRQRLIVRRPYATARVLDWIAPRTCWHLDVWLRRTTNGHLYFDARTHAGAWELLGRNVWYIRAPVVGQWEAVPIDAATLGDTARHASLALNDLPALDCARVNELHWRHIAPLASLWPRGDYPRRSCAFHYIAALPAYDDPTRGMVNGYAYSRRAERDLRASIRHHLKGLL